MGNKSAPRSIRLGISQPHDAVWYSEPKHFPAVLSEDIRIRRFLSSRVSSSVPLRVVIYRFRGCIEINVYCVKPGLIVGKKGVDIENLSSQLSYMTGQEIRLKVVEVRKPELSAGYIAREVGSELKKKRVACRRVIKKFVQSARRFGALGVRIECSGRLAGAEIARREWYQEGAVPRQKFRADVEYSSYDALSSWGVCGVKVWVYKGDVVGEDVARNLGFVEKEERGA